MDGTSIQVGDDGSKELVVDLADDIQKLVADVHPYSTNSCIFKVPVHIRSVNNACYTPKLISLGPLHHGDEKLKSTEIYKVRYLDALRRISPTPSTVLQDLIKCLQALEEKARNSYEDHSTLNFTSDQFVKMMLLDGCFIIMFLLLSHSHEARDVNDPIFFTRSIHGTLYNDMMLLENQLPYFVLEQLYVCINKNTWCCYSLTNLVSGLFKPFDQAAINLRSHGYQGKHFVDYELKCRLPSPTPTHQERTLYDRVRHFLGYLLHCRRDNEINLPSATELHQSGIEFSKCDSVNILDVKFTHGRIEMPRLSLYDSTQERFRNLIAMEQYRRNGTSYMTDYVHLMDYLINTHADAALLRSRGILDNCLGSDEEVAQILNNMLKGVYYDIKKSHYRPLIERINAHYNKPWNLWKAKLRQDYFNSPWAIISFNAAVVLLVCTLVQTVFSVFFSK